MAKPKFDYDGEHFYKEIYALAMQGLSDAEIAYNISDNLGVVGLDPTTFAKMKNGDYAGWNDEENKKRSERICQELAHGRARILGIVRGRYLKAALGGLKVKGKVVRSRHMIVEGVITDDLIVETTESEQETPPNLQALSNFLYHHDPQYRNIQKGLEDVQEPVNKGVDIAEWLKRENNNANKDA